MHLRSRNLPRPSASSPPSNRSHPMANPGQAPDLEGLHREIHDMAKHMRIMNENNGRLMQLLAAANPPLPAAPPVPDIERSRHSNRSGDRSQKCQCQPSRKGETPSTKLVLTARDKSTSQKIRDLDARLDAINTGTNAPVTVDTLIRQTEPPFTRRVLRARISSKFKLPTQLGIYEGKTDPMDHLDSYKSLMSLQGCSDEKNASHLFTVHQKETESLKDFVKRFNQAILEVEDPSDKVIIMAMMEGLPPGPLFDSLSKNVPKTLSALQSKADKYIAAEEEETRYKRPDRDPKRSSNRCPRTPPHRPEFILPPLNAPVAQVLSEIKHEEFVKWPEKIKTDPQKRNRKKYCEFHRDHGHNTEDCFQLKEQIADLIKRGYLRKYVADRPPPNSPERRYGDNRPTAGNIQTIHGGFGSGGCSTSSRKWHARSAFRLAEEEICNLSSPYVGDQLPVTRYLQILIDNESSADILFISAFERMKVGLDKLHPFHTPLIGFGGNTTHPLGWINLPITLGTEPHQITVWQDFIVVDCPSPYNAILGRPTWGGIKAITSTYHLKNMGDDTELLRDEVEQLTLANPRKTNNAKPLEEVVPISIHPDYPDCHIMIGTKLTDELRFALVNFLKKNYDVFARSQGDVPASPSIGVANQILQTEESPTWMDEIIAYLQGGTLPTDKLQARSLQYRSARFCIFKGRLYKRSFSGPLLKCLRPEEAEYVLKEIHEGICVNYSGASHLPHTEMVPMSSLWPFAQWKIDILGPLPQAPLQRKFLIVAIDYFTKWIEAQPLAKITKKNTREFVWKHLVYRFGILKVIISDNARQFDNDKFRTFCSDLAISHHFSSPGHPQANNGQVEVTNRTILRNLKARLDRSKSEWAEDLPSILWAYHTTSRIPTSETPYSMVFGTESVIPVEIGMPSFRTSNFDEESNESELRLNLDLLEERREKADLRQAAYKCQVAKYYNQRVKHRSFLPADLVLRKVTQSTKEPNAGKLGPTWEGPYKVVKVSRPGTYWLEDPNGKTLLHPWNAEHLKKYYQ
ncbi:hypothetical protein Acr_05g0011600 [Actinidia rufa]|uniref:Integrase catalytic domain-containing protein n=1 Tax=Actinidia rufa TaxID=165716 RepID=A0A7J0EM28_9ERIC|nr:hypothetical protein Acr_05g0011600 [Actinidia rufa]